MGINGRGGTAVVATAAASWLTLFAPSSVAAIGAYQSGPNVGALYAGGLSFVSNSNELLATGITYDDNGAQPTAECSCFLARFDSSSLQTDALKASRIGSGNIVETCSAISYVDNSNFVVVGNSDPGGMFGKPNVATGFAMTLTVDDFQVKVGKVLESDEVSYPVTVLAYETPSIFVATLTSTSLDPNPSAESVRNQYNEPNWLQYKQYGYSYEMTIEAIDFQSDVNVMTTLWSSNFPINPDSTGNKEDVYLGGMILKKLESGERVLVVAGSTRGQGDGYGDADGNDEDGFITVVDTETGKISELVNRNNRRIGTAEDDVIAGICDDPNDVNAFYIVGTTKGVMAPPTSAASPPAGSLQAYVQKMNVTSLASIWTVQWAASKPDNSITVAGAMECIVSDDGMVYVAGVVDDGASISDDTSSNGGDDIFVSQILGENGSVQWIQQLGSAGDEQLARGGSLALDPHQDLIVFGDTTGSFYRSRGGDETTSDIFLVTLYKNNGSYPPTGSALIPASPAPEPEETSPVSSPTSDEDVGSSVTGQGTMDASLGIQSGPIDGSSFAGGMVYDAGKDFVYLTGITYDQDFFGVNSEVATTTEPKCLVVSVSLDSGEIWDWEEAQTYGSVDSIDVCSGIAVHRSSELVVVGHGNDGLNDALGPIAGFVRALDRGNLAQTSSVHLVTTEPLSRFEYPVSVVSDGDDVYILSLTSTDSEFSAEYNELDSADPTKEPNWINIQKYGSSFDMTVTKLSLSSPTTIDGLPAGQTQFLKVWSKEFPIDPNPSNGQKPRVWLGGAILKKVPGYLAIVGSTKGMGSGYGDAVGEDEDGFITLLDLETGELASNVPSNNKREGSEKDDIINGICHDPEDQNYFYIVGETFGSVGDDLSDSSFASGSLFAFVRKIDANGLSNVWTKQFGASMRNAESPGQVYALSCAVSGDVVYAGGVVDNNAGIVIDAAVRETQGGDDVWVGQFSISDGSLRWLHQVGSPGNDHMAPRSGIITTSSGNAILYGDTNGAAFRDREVSNQYDLMVMTFDRAGQEYENILLSRVPTPQPTGLATTAPEPAPLPGVPQQPTAVQTIDIPLGPAPGKVPAPTTTATMQNQKEGLSPIATAFLILGILIILTIPTWWFFCRGSKGGFGFGGGRGKRSRSRRRRRRRHRKAMDDTDDEEDRHENDFATLEILEKRQTNGLTQQKDGIFSTVYSDDPLKSGGGSFGGNLHNISELTSENKGREVI
jgi:hypothetical protein